MHENRSTCFAFRFQLGSVANAMFNVLVVM